MRSKETIKATRRPAQDPRLPTDHSSIAVGFTSTVKLLGMSFSKSRRASYLRVISVRILTCVRTLARCWSAVAVSK